MEVKTKYKSALQLEEILITEGSFRRTSGSLEGIELGIKVNREISQDTQDLFNITLDTVVADNAERIFVFVKCSAKFRTTQSNSGLIERNAIAIMFPFVRSYISLLTTQPGMSPIVLPAMNIVAMLEDN